jgi:hypothetical protein
LSAVSTVLLVLSRRNLRPSGFARPLFSWPYELLFPQPIYFQKYLRCYGGGPSCCFRALRSLCLCIENFTNSFTDILLRTPGCRQKTQLLCNQANPNSFRKAPGGWGLSATTPPTLRLFLQRQRLVGIVAESVLAFAIVQWLGLRHYPEAIRKGQHYA